MFGALYEFPTFMLFEVPKYCLVDVILFPESISVIKIPRQEVLKRLSSIISENADQCSTRVGSDPGSDRVGPNEENFITWDLLGPGVQKRGSGYIRTFQQQRLY